MARRRRRNPDRPIAERIEEVFDPEALSGYGNDPDLRRAIARLDAVGGVLYDTETLPDGAVPAGAFGWPNFDGTFSLVKRVTVWGLDPSRRGQPDPLNPGCVLFGRPTADWREGCLVGAYCELEFNASGEITGRRDHFTGLEPADRQWLDKAVQALLDELERRGRRPGSGTFERPAEQVVALLAPIVRELRRRGYTPTEDRVIAYLDNYSPEYAGLDKRQLRRWIHAAHFADWDDFLQSVGD